jgi:hypothetical protein
MQQSNLGKLSKLAPPPKRRTPPSEQTDEAPGLVENEQVDVEREGLLGENESIEQNPRDRPDPEPPAFEE